MVHALCYLRFDLMAFFCFHQKYSFVRLKDCCKSTTTAAFLADKSILVLKWKEAEKQA